MPTLWVKFGNGRPVQVDVQESANVYHLIKAIKEELHPKLSNVSLDEIDICINPTDTNAIPRNILVTEIYYGHPERHKNTYESPLAVLANVSPYPGSDFVSLTNLEDPMVRFMGKLSAFTHVSPSMQEFIKRRKSLCHQFSTCKEWDKATLYEFLDRALCTISASTNEMTIKKYGYSFDKLLYISLKPMISVGFYEVTNQNEEQLEMIDGILMPTRKYWAKVGRLESLNHERNVASIVKGNYVMPILDSIELEGYDRIQRLAIIAPRYSGSMGGNLYNVRAPDDEHVVSMLLCGLSAIYSFSSKEYGHRDIKLENLLILNSHECVLGDFGSAAQLNPLIESPTTANIGMNQRGITIAYDVTCLASAIGHMVIRERLTFGGKNHLLIKVEDFVKKYPVTLEMLKRLTIDEDIKDSAELLDNWNAVASIAEKHMPHLIVQFPNLKPTLP